MLRKRHISCVCLRSYALAASALVILSALGCGDGRPKRVPVSGVVLLDGEPLPNCHLQFVPTEGRASRGHTDEQGRFSLTCYDPDDGVLTGTQRVAVSAFREINGETIQWNVPKKYMNHKTSGLQYEITEPVEDLKVEITWAGDQPFVERSGVRLRNYVDRGARTEATE